MPEWKFVHSSNSGSWNEVTYTFGGEFSESSSQTFDGVGLSRIKLRLIFVSLLFDWMKALGVLIFSGL